eukprot:Pgem_evm1s20046
MDDDGVEVPNWYQKIEQKLETLEQKQQTQQQRNDYIELKMNQISEDQKKHLTNSEEKLYSIQENVSQIITKND